MSKIDARCHEWIKVPLEASLHTTLELILNAFTRVPSLAIDQPNTSTVYLFEGN